MAEGDINLATLWVPVMPETSKIGEAMRKAGEEGRRHFESGFNSGGFDQVFSQLSTKSVAFGAAIGSTIGTVFGNLATGALRMFGDAVEEAFSTAIGMAEKFAGEIVSAGETIEGINRQLELFTQNAEHLKGVAQDILGNMDSDAKHLGDDLAMVSDRLGGTDQQLEKFVGHIEMLRDRLGNFDLDSLTQALGAFGVATADDDDKLSELIWTQQRFGVSANTIVQQLASQSQAFIDLGLNIDQSIYLLGKLDETNKGAADNIQKMTSTAEKAAAKRSEGIRQYVTDETAIIRHLHEIGRDDLAQQEAFAAFGARTWQQAIAFGDAYNETLRQSPEELAHHRADLDKVAQATETLHNAWQKLHNAFVTTIGPVAAAIMEKLVGALNTVSGWFTAHHDQIIGKIRDWGDKFIEALPKIQHFVGEAIRITGTFIDFFVHGLGYIIEGLGVISGSDALYNLGKSMTHFDASGLSNRIADAVEKPNIDTEKLKGLLDEALHQADPNFKPEVHPQVMGPDGKPTTDPNAIVGIPKDLHVKITPDVDTSHIPPWLKFLLGGLPDALVPNTPENQQRYGPGGPEGIPSWLPGGTPGSNTPVPPGSPNILPGPGHQGIPIPAHTSSYTDTSTGGGGGGGGPTLVSSVNPPPPAGNVGSGGPVRDQMIARILQDAAQYGLTPTETRMIEAVGKLESNWSGPGYMGFGPEAAAVGVSFNNNPLGAVDRFFRQFIERRGKEGNPNDPQAVADYIWHTVHNAADPNYGAKLLAIFNAGSFAQGGPSGDDNIPAWLSAGEFVVNKESTKKYGWLLKMLNAKGFAGGGQTDDSTSLQGVDPQLSATEKIAHGFGLAMTSGRYNHPQDQGLHPSGQAGDFSDGDKTVQELAFATYMYDNYGASLAELIHDQPNWKHNVKDGKDVGAFGNVYTMGQAGYHGDHVHIAIRSTVPMDNSQPGNQQLVIAGPPGGGGGTGPGAPGSPGMPGRGGGSPNPFTGQTTQQLDDEQAQINLQTAQQNYDAAVQKRDLAKQAFNDPGVQAAGPDSELYKSKKDELDKDELAVRNEGIALQRAQIAAAKQDNKPDKQDKSGNKMQLPDVLTGALDMLGFGNVFGGKNPMDWEIVKLAKGVAQWGFGLAEFFSKAMGDKYHVPGFAGGGGGGGNGGGGPSGGGPTVDTGGLVGLPNIPHIPTPNQPHPGDPSQGNPNVGLVSSVTHDNSITVTGNQFADHAQLVKQMQEQQNQRFHTNTGGLPAMVTV